MPTNVSEFDGVCYAVAYRIHGNRIVVLDLHRSDRAGVRKWLAACDYPRFGAYLMPAVDTNPGFYVKPFVSDSYYWIDPITKIAESIGQSQFGNPRTVTELDGFRGSIKEEVDPKSHSLLGAISLSIRRSKVAWYSGFGFITIGILIATMAGIDSMQTQHNQIWYFTLPVFAGTVMAIAGAWIVHIGSRSSPIIRIQVCKSGDPDGTVDEQTTLHVKSA